MSVLLWLGAAVDTVMAILLVVVLGFVLDSWHDPNGRWVGVVVTSMWALAFAGCAAAPGLAFWLRRHNARPSRVLLAVWAPALALTAICVVGFMIAPP